MADTIAEASEPLPEFHFLDEVSAAHLLAQLRGIQTVTVRLLGDNAHAGPEVVAFLAASGFEVTSETLQRMVPPPSRRFVFRYKGPAATVTIAPYLD